VNTDTKDKERGLYEKFRVERTDGRSAPGEKHEGCDYFVLDLRHDPFAYTAAQAYADACSWEYPQLSLDLRRKAIKGVTHQLDTKAISGTPEQGESK
jgi:hypothetical protein